MTENNTDVFVPDTSALMAFIEAEDGADFTEEILIRAERKEISVYISFISLTEVMYITLQEKDESTARQRIELIKTLACSIEESGESLNMAAARIKARNRISLADSYIAALTQERNAVLVHKDPEFENLLLFIKQHKLPYKV